LEQHLPPNYCKNNVIVLEFIKVTKNELEVALHSFTAEQEKLHDNYEKKKKEITDRVDILHKELEKLETDT
jgi:hypothetical protein